MIDCSQTEVGAGIAAAEIALPWINETDPLPSAGLQAHHGSISITFPFGIMGADDQPMCAAGSDVAINPSRPCNSRRHHIDSAIVIEVAPH